MINLIPPDAKQTIVYARRNRLLLRWVIVLLAALGGMAVIIIFGRFYINSSVNSYRHQAEQTREQLQVQKLEETQKRVEDISSSLKLAVDVLSREVLFSKLIRQVGAAMPANTVLTGLEITKIEGGIDLNAAAIDYGTATQIQVNLQDPDNGIFEKADIVSINCSSAAEAGSAAVEPAGTPSQYPCEVQIRALFAKDNPYLFINSQTAETSGATTP